MYNIKYKINSKEVYKNNISSFIKMNRRHWLPFSICNNNETRQLFILGFILSLNVIELFEMNLLRVIFLSVITAGIPEIFENFKTKKIIPYLEIVYASLLTMGISAINIIQHSYIEVVLCVLLYVFELINIKQSNDMITNFKENFSNYFSHNIADLSIETCEDNINRFSYKINDNEISFINNDIAALYVKETTDDCFFLLKTKPLSDIYETTTDMNKIYNYVYIKFSELANILKLNINEPTNKNIDNVFNIINKLDINLKNTHIFVCK